MDEIPDVKASSEASDQGDFCGPTKPQEEQPASGAYPPVPTDPKTLKACKEGLESFMVGMT